MEEQRERRKEGTGKGKKVGGTGVFGGDEVYELG
jgi:hypothetical protein